MGFLRGSDGADSEPDEQPGEAGQAEALARIEARGIPLAAERRLQALGQDGSLFTSGLSVNEFALLGALGPRPMAQVMGGSVPTRGLRRGGTRSIG
ncbi:MAG: hypothetical protein WB761_06845 [Solirubrobacteraceae bacterium]